MAVVYRYTDLADNNIKYVGIVYADNRTLKQRVEEHLKEDWVQDRAWKIEYLLKEIDSRTDAEYLEAHYISKFGTNDWYNKAKANWGESSLIDDSKDEWVIYSIDEKPISKWIRETTIEDVNPYEAYESLAVKIKFANEEEKVLIYLDNFYVEGCKCNTFDLFTYYQIWGLEYEDIPDRTTLTSDIRNKLVGQKITYKKSEIDGRIEYIQNNGITLFASSHSDLKNGCIIDSISIEDYLKCNKDCTKDEIFKDFLIPLNTDEETRLNIIKKINKVFKTKDEGEN